MPLLFDMPLEKLRAYEGTNPRPDDFDAYWDRALAEMRAVEARVELRRAGFRTAFAECFDLYFTGVGGARVHAKLLRPTGAPAPHAGLILLHGYAGNCGGWVDKLGYAAAGFTVAALDCRGQGGLSEDVGGVKGKIPCAAILFVAWKINPTNFCSARSFLIRPNWPAW